MWLDEVVALITFVMVPTAVTSIIDDIYSDVSSTWFRSLRKPMWVAPNHVFQEVWTVVLLLLGLASFIVWETPERSFLPLLIYTLLLILTWAWTPIFFVTKSLTASLVIVAALIPTADFCIYLFYEVNQLAGFLVAPFPLWLIYIAYLNFSMYFLNNELIAK